MSDVINRGLSLVVSLAVLIALFAALNVPGNPARRLLDIIRQMF